MPSKSPSEASAAAAKAPEKTERFYSGAPWEAPCGYCRALKVGPMVLVSGTAPVGPDGRTMAPGDAYGQMRRCLEIVEGALTALGAELRHVVRTRMFVTDISRWEEFARAHGEVFRDFPPATSMVEVRGLIGPEMLCEIEVDAYVG